MSCCTGLRQLCGLSTAVMALALGCEAAPDVPSTYPGESLRRRDAGYFATMHGCQGSDAQEVERRSHLAILLALEDRHYVIETTEMALPIIANFESKFRSGFYTVSWEIHLIDGGELEFFLPGQDLLGNRKAKIEDWFAKLEASFSTYKCKASAYLEREAVVRGGWRRRATLLRLRSSGTHEQHLDD